MTVEELEREVMALSGAERSELFKRLERHALYDRRGSTVTVFSNDLTADGADNPIANVFHCLFPRVASEPDITIDIFSEIAKEAASVCHPVIEAFIRRWEFVIRNKHRFSPEVVRFAAQHLERIGHAMRSGAEERATPVKHVVTEHISKEEFYYLGEVVAALRDQRIKLRESWEDKSRILKTRLHGKSKALLRKEEERLEEEYNAPSAMRMSESLRLRGKASSLQRVAELHEQMINKVLDFLQSDLRPSSSKKEAWRNAYVAWRNGISATTAKEYLSQLRRDVAANKIDDLTRTVIQQDNGWRPTERVYCSEAFSVQLPWVEILKTDLR